MFCGDWAAEVSAAITTWGERLTCGRRGRVTTAVGEVMDSLTAWRDRLAPAAWTETTQILRASVLLPILLEDPFTRWCYIRPNGQSVDADRFDDIAGFGHGGERLREATPAGRWIFAAIRSRPLWRAIRQRRLIEAEFLRRTVRERPDPRVLVVSAGPVPDTQPDPPRGPQPGSAFGATAPATRQGDRRWPQVETTRISVQDLRRQKHFDGPEFDAAHGLGPFDYLPDAAAEDLLAGLVTRMRPAGRILVCNYALDAADRGYMEAFMDWHLVYRDEQDLLRLAEKAGPGLQARSYRDPSRQIVFLELTKAA